jgi:hypothetical protein
MTQNKLRSIVAFVASATLALVCVQQAASITLPSIGGATQPLLA